MGRPAGSGRELQSGRNEAESERTALTVKKYDVTALGELLTDFTHNGESAQGNPMFEANPGGAPCNVLSMLCRLGRRTAFIGKVGDDMFGGMLRDKAAAQGIDMSGLVMDPEVPTTLAFVRKLPDGDRDFSFYRKPGADMMLCREDVQEHRDVIESCSIFHFGSLSMTDPRCADATEEAIVVAKAAGALISFDPNYRDPLWDSGEMARRMIARGLAACDILKISDNEIELMTGTDDIDRGCLQLMDEFDIPLVFATLGPDGSKAFVRGEDGDAVRTVFAPAVLTPATVETTGAGDTFCACALHFVLAHLEGRAPSDGPEGYAALFADLTDDELKELLAFANAAASLVTTRRGALCVMPGREEVLAWMEKNRA